MDDAERVVGRFNIMLSRKEVARLGISWRVVVSGRLASNLSKDFGNNVR